MLASTTKVVEESAGSTSLPASSRSSSDATKSAKPRAPRVTVTNENGKCVVTSEFPGILASLGTMDESFANRLLGQLVDVLHPRAEPVEERTVNAAIAAIHGIQPRDELEAMLASQMVALHSLAMRKASQAAAEKQTFPDREHNARHVAKLMRVFCAQVEALQRYRGKGEQRMTVEHVHVHPGAQAVVGQVSAEGGGGGIVRKGETTP